MTQALYDIYFTGQLIAGTNQESAQKHLAAVFKTNAESVAKLFNGKPHVLKRGLNKEQAQKYKDVLNKIGLIIAFKAHQLANNTTKEAVSTGTVTSALTQESDQTEKGFSLAPIGSDILNKNEKRRDTTREIDTSNIKLLSSFITPSVEEKFIPPAPDTSHLSIAQVGENLLIEPKQESAPLKLNLDALSLAPPGADLEQLPDERVPVTPNIGGIDIAPMGSLLTNLKINIKTPAPPNIDHLALIKS